MSFPPTRPSLTTRGNLFSLFWVFLRLGLTSFGGPVAHLGYFRAEFVERRRWLDEATYADIVALCQFLPGPASSQVGMSIGILKAGLPGAIAAWLGFTLPSAIMLVLFAFGVGRLRDWSHVAWLHGLKVVAVAVVAQAVWSMARALCPDRIRVTLAVMAALLAFAVPSAMGQISAIVCGGLIGWHQLRADVVKSDISIIVPFGSKVSLAALCLFVAMLLGLPIMASEVGSHVLALASSFFRSGALVFGGGHVVLPLLQQAVVPNGWINNDLFMAGYGAAQVVPGPLFTFAAYLGAVMHPSPNGWLGALICLVSIFLPSFLLLVGVLPYWDGLRRRADVQSALKGVNAAVVGLLLAALFSPVWTSAIFDTRDFSIALSAFVLLVFWRLPPWLVVLGGALAETALASLA